MKTKRLLIADSGSTKTDWHLIDNNRSKNYRTQGINPYFVTPSDVTALLQTELKINPAKQVIDEVHFYGAGLGNPENKKWMQQCFKKYFGKAKIFMYSDILASARATCGSKAGIVCILGTGSNSCKYNGKSIGFKTPALGYILGDEGGATQLGKKVLQYHYHGIFDAELQAAFAEQFPASEQEILENLYRKPLGNRYLAQFAHFIFTQRGHYMIENIAEDCLNDFFINHLLRYPGLAKTKVHFTGSVAFALKDIVKNLCEQYELTLGTITQKPMKGLISFHQKG